MDKRRYLIKGSLKQLMRTPIKTLLFFLPIMAASLLLAFSGSRLVETSRLIAAAENEFVTLGTVEQVRDAGETRPIWNTCSEAMQLLSIDTYQELLGPETLEFQGAEYVQPPATRPNYVAYLPDHFKSFHHSGGYAEVSEFTVKEILDDRTIVVELERILYLAQDIPAVTPDMDFGSEEGEEITVCLHSQPEPQDFQVGKRYIGTLAIDWNYSWAHEFEDSWEKHRMVLSTGPFSTQVDANTHMPVNGDRLPAANNLWRQDGAWKYIQPGPASQMVENSTSSDLVYADEVTEDFYDEGGRGELWLNWAEGLKRDILGQKNFPVVPANDLDLFPSFHNGDAIIKRGRAITGEEFSTGQKVCLVTPAFASKNLLDVGDKIPLSLVYSMYGTYPTMDGLYTFGGKCSPLNAQGELYEPFWEDEYEIVGFYDIPYDEDFQYLWSSNHEILGDSIIIPAKSVEASDENNIAYYAPMNAGSTSFIIPNGTIEEFDKKLHEAVPEASKLSITYNDNGYTEVMDSLNNAKLSSIMLFFMALLAALAIVVLLLYFFVVKEKKRTAIERSLGMTKRQCRVSLVSGIVIAALTASLLGSIGGAVLMETVDFSTEEQEDFGSEYSLDYSMWAKVQSRAELEVEVPTPWAVYAAVPLALTAAVLALSVGMVDKSLGIEPIYLLSSKEE